MNSADDEIPPGEVTRLAELSRAFREAEREITRAIAQEMGRTYDPDWRAQVGKQFGLSAEEFSRYQPREILRLHRGYIHRAGLWSFDQVLRQVMREIRTGALKPGDQFPPRTKFTNQYHCDKRTHADVVARLTRMGVICRPAGDGGSMVIQAPANGTEW